MISPDLILIMVVALISLTQMYIPTSGYSMICIRTLNDKRYDKPYTVQKFSPSGHNKYLHIFIESYKTHFLCQ